MGDLPWEMQQETSSQRRDNFEGRTGRSATGLDVEKGGEGGPRTNRYRGISKECG